MQPESRAKSWKRLEGVDLLRGISILLVLLNHVNMQLLFAHVPYTRGWPPRLITTLVWNGQYGVQMFFVVSGFLITATTLRRWKALPAVNIRAFYGLRFARVAPLLLGLLVLLSVLDLAQVPEFVVRAHEGGLGGALFAALTFHVNWLEAHRGYLPGPWDVLWSLSVEETFYLVFPLACRLLRGRWFAAMLGCLVAAGPVGRTVLAGGNPVWREYSYIGSMDAIAMGCLTALVVTRVRMGRALGLALGAVGAVLVLFVLCGFPEVHAWGLARRGLDMSVVAAGACLWVAASAALRLNTPWIFRPLTWLGRQSYEVYLTHMFVVLGLFALYRASGAPARGAPLLFLAVIGAAGLLGGVTARWYSEPANRALRMRFGEGPARMGAAVDQTASQAADWAIGSLADPEL